MTPKGWKQFKMMSKGVNKAQYTPMSVLDVIPTIIKEGEHFWLFGNEIVLDVHQKTDESIHPQSTHITELIINSKFTNNHTTETLKLILLQHAIKYHEACAWLFQQNQVILTYCSLLTHSKTLETWSEQYKKAKGKGCARLTAIKAATSTWSSIHQDTLNTQCKCSKCVYSHRKGSCPAFNNECCNCGGRNNFITLCRKP